MGGDLLFPLCLGGCLVGAAAAVPAYFVSLRLVVGLRRRRDKRRVRRRKGRKPATPAE